MNIFGVRWTRFGLATLLLIFICHRFWDDHDNLVAVLIPTLIQLLLIDLSFREELKRKQVDLDKKDEIANELVELLKRDLILRSSDRGFGSKSIESELAGVSSSESSLSTDFDSSRKDYLENSYYILRSQGKISQGLYEHLVNRLR